MHIGDRESDIYELFCLAKELGTHFLVSALVLIGSPATAHIRFQMQ